MKLKFLLLASLVIIVCPNLVSQVPDNSVREIPRRTELPYNRLIQPAGLQIFFGNESLENHAMDAAVSPDGKWLAVEERYSIVFISTDDNSIRYKLLNNARLELSGGLNTYSGITWYTGEKGPEVFWSAIGRNGISLVASAVWDGTKAEFSRLSSTEPPPGARWHCPMNCSSRRNQAGITCMSYSTGTTWW